MRANYRPLMKDDLIKVCNLDLRNADKEELEAASGAPWKEALANSVAGSDISWVITLDDEIVGVFGLSELEPHVGVPWLVATDKLGQFSFRFAKESKLVIELMLMLYPVLINFVYSKHTEAIRWLEWLGFSVDREVQVYIGNHQVPFYPFGLRRTGYV